MDCLRCGLENEPGAAYCKHCGASLTAAAPQDKPAKKKRGGIIAGIIALSVAVLLAAIYLLPGLVYYIDGLWVCQERGWALRIDGRVLTEYSPAGVKQTDCSLQKGRGGAMLKGGLISFTVDGEEMTLTDEETGEQYLFVRQDDADVEALIVQELRGIWSSQELSRVIEMGSGTLTLYTAAGESDGSFTFGLKEGQGAISLDGKEYAFTAGWDTITVEGMGVFTRADRGLDVAAFVRENGSNALTGTWYDAAGQYGTITFREDGGCRVKLYGIAIEGAYTFDIATGEGFITPDAGEPMRFILADGTLAMEDVTYTRQYVEQPDSEDFYAAVAGEWVAVKNHNYVFEFAGDGTLVFRSDDAEARGSFFFNPVNRTGSVFLGDAHYSLRMTGDTLQIGDAAYKRAEALDIPERDPDSLIGMWYDAAGEAGTLNFAEDGTVVMESRGAVYSGTYTFDKAGGSGKMMLDIGGRKARYNIYLLNGRLYTDDSDLIYTQKYVEQDSTPR